MKLVPQDFFPSLLNEEVASKKNQENYLIALLAWFIVPQPAALGSPHIGQFFPGLTESERVSEQDCRPPVSQPVRERRRTYLRTYKQTNLRTYVGTLTTLTYTYVHVHISMRLMPGRGYHTNAMQLVRAIAAVPILYVADS